MVIWTHSLARASVFLTIEKQSHWLGTRIRNRCWGLIRKEKMNNALAVDRQNKLTRIQEGFGEILHVYRDDSCHDLKLGHLISSLLFSSTHRLYLGRAGFIQGEGLFTAELKSRGLMPSERCKAGTVEQGMQTFLGRKRCLLEG